jgi:hypothetical protein
MMDLFEMFEDTRRYHEKLDNAYARLAANLVRPEIKVGDRVVVAAGLLCRGHIWVRRICTVLEVAENTVHVRCDSDWGKWEEWIEYILITDVLPKGEIVLVKDV